MRLIQMMMRDGLICKKLSKDEYFLDTIKKIRPSSELAVIDHARICSMFFCMPDPLFKGNEE